MSETRYQREEPMSKEGWKAVPLAVSVYHHGSPIFGESSYHVSVDDKAGGPFIKIKSHHDELEKGVVEIDFEALELVTEEARKLMNYHDKEKSDD